MSSRIPRSAVEKMARCQEIIGYRFQNFRLLHQALNTQKNQRLGVIGDLVTRLVVMDRWYEAKQLTPRDWADGVSSCLTNTNLCRIGTRKGLAVCTIQPLPVVPPGRKTVADMVEAILGAVYKDAVYKSGNRDAAGFKVLEGVVDRLGITSELLMSHSSRRWMLWQVKTARVLEANYFDGHHWQFKDVMDHLGDNGQLIRLPRDEMGQFTGYLPLNQALLDRREAEGQDLIPPPVKLGIWDRLREKLWRGRWAARAARDKPRELRRLKPTPGVSSADPVESSAAGAKDHLVRDAQQLKSELQNQTSPMSLSSLDGQSDFGPIFETRKEGAVSQLRRDLVEEKARANSLECELREARKHLDELRGTVSSGRKESEKLQEKLGKMTGECTSIRLDTASQHSQIVQLEEKLDEARRLFHFVRDQLKRSQAELEKSQHELGVLAICLDAGGNPTEVAKVSAGHDDAQTTARILSPTAQVTEKVDADATQDGAAAFRINPLVPETFVEFIDRTIKIKLPNNKNLWPSWLDAQFLRFRQQPESNALRSWAMNIENDPEAWYERAKVLVNENPGEWYHRGKPPLHSTAQKPFEDFIAQTTGDLLPKLPQNWPVWLLRKRQRLEKGQERLLSEGASETSNDVGDWHREAQALLQEFAKEQIRGTFASFVIWTLGVSQTSLPSKTNRWPWLVRMHSNLKSKEEAGQLPMGIDDADGWFEAAKALMLDEETFRVYVERTTGGDTPPFCDVASRLADPNSDWQNILHGWRMHMERLRENNELPEGVTDVDEWFKRAETLLNKMGEQKQLYWWRGRKLQNARTAHRSASATSNA